VFGKLGNRTLVTNGASMKNRRLAGLALVTGLCAGLVLPHSAGADQPPLRVGIVSTYSGFFTEEGKSADAAIAAFVKEHGDMVAGRKIEIIKRDDGGVGPDKAKRLAQELIINDNVDFLLCSIYSPNAKAVGGVSTTAKKPAFYINGGYGLLEGNPYTARFAYAQAQLIYPLADWALKNKFKRVSLLYLNFSAGLDAASSFRTAFTAGGGTIVGDVAVPATATDFSAYIQRIRESKPQAVFIFLTSQSPSFLKEWASSGAPQSGIKLLATAETNELELPVLGDDALGIYTAQNYSAAHDSKLNKQFSHDLHAADASIPSPDFYTVALYDALQAIYKITAAQNGTIDPDKTMALVRGMKFESPRGPIEIDPQTREIIQNIYIRRVDKVNGVLQNTEIATYPHVKDPLEK
jgi:branched-chain amino acid transport system substrate-binding protein